VRRRRRSGELEWSTAAELLALVPEHLRYHPVVRYPDETEEAFSERLRAEREDSPIKERTKERYAWYREHGVDLVDLLRAQRELRLAASRAAYPDEAADDDGPVDDAEFRRDQLRP
jgi:hypothetical protein